MFGISGILPLESVLKILILLKHFTCINACFLRKNNIMKIGLGWQGRAKINLRNCSSSWPFKAEPYPTESYSLAFNF